MPNHIDVEAQRAIEIQEWWKARGHDVQACVDADEVKRAYLLGIYSALYSELRDKDARQQQVMTWGFTVLAGSGLISAVIGQGRLTLLASGMVVFVLVLFVIALLLLVVGYSMDRQSIARQLDRVHEVMRVFAKGEYYQESSLFDPTWRGWGFDRRRDVNWRLTIVCCALLVLALCANVVILFSVAAHRQTASRAEPLYGLIDLNKNNDTRCIASNGVRRIASTHTSSAGLPTPLPHDR